MLKIVAMNGPPGSGKDTAYEALEESQPEDFDWVMRFSYVDALKEATHLLFGLDTGFGDPLFYEDQKDKPLDDFLGFTPRQAYIDMGLYVREHFGQNILTRALCKKIKYEFGCKGSLLAVVTDLGFQDEIDTLATEFGPENVLLFKLDRPGTNFKKDSRDYVTYPKNVDICKTWNIGTQEEHKQAVCEMVNKWLKMEPTI